jgi:protein phosphatase-4 regulatory subunit 3
MDGDEEAYFEGDDDIEEDEGLPTGVKQSLVNGASPVRPLVTYPDDDDAEDNIDILASSPEHEKEKKSSSSLSDDQRTLTDPTEENVAEPMDEDTLSSDPAEGEDGRGRDRKSAPIEGSPGKQDIAPEPLAMKRPREEDDEDELGKMMGGVKRRISSASLNSKAARLQMDGAVNSPVAPPEENGGHTTNSQRAYGHGHGNSHILRRKGSLRSKNENPATLGKFAIKPVGQSAMTLDADDVDELAGDGKEESKESADPGGGGKGG